MFGFRLTDHSTMTLSLLEGYSMGGLPVIGASSARDTGHRSKYRHHEDVFCTPVFASTKIVGGRRDQVLGCLGSLTMTDPVIPHPLI